MYELILSKPNKTALEGILYHIITYLCLLQNNLYLNRTFFLKFCNPQLTKNQVNGIAHLVFVCKRI